MEKTAAILSERQHRSRGAPGEVKALQSPLAIVLTGISTLSTYHEAHAPVGPFGHVSAVLLRATAAAGAHLQVQVCVRGRLQPQSLNLRNAGLTEINGAYSDRAEGAKEK